MTLPEGWFEEAELREKAEAWVAEVAAAYSGGGYAAGDGPRPPLDEMEWLLAERAKALRIIDAWHQFSNHLTRIVESSPTMLVVDALAFLTTERERIEEAKRG